MSQSPSPCPPACHHTLLPSASIRHRASLQPCHLSAVTHPFLPCPSTHCSESGPAWELLVLDSYCWFTDGTGRGDCCTPGWLLSLGGGRWPQGVRTRQPDSALVQPGRGAWDVREGRMEASICGPACHLGQAAGTPAGGSAPPFCRGSCHRCHPWGQCPARCFSASHSCAKVGVTSRLTMLTLTTHPVPWDVCSTLVCPSRAAILHGATLHGCLHPGGLAGLSGLPGMGVGSAPGPIDPGATLPSAVPMPLPGLTTPVCHLL